ncbi:MAG TPA: MaoC/PaaZ C-terminal domain-containing protein [Pseudonocardiaceae bacterium]|jgi:acyl dehydratase|nr:MaoC/PaaZ C-terminal domain-containing protein [Pseudonocardiaceae bacterium]
MSDRAALVGRRYESRGLRVDADASYAYAEVIGDDPQRHADRDTAAPFFAVALIAPLWRAVYQSSELDTEDQNVLHAEQRMLLRRELRIGETLTGRAEVTEVVGFGFNDAAIIRCDLLDADDRAVVSMESTLAIQGSSGYPPIGRHAAAPSRDAVAVRLSRCFDQDAPARYADAADDHNPLHLDDDAARAAGHPGRIVHGMCTLATGISALVEKLRDRPDTRLGYLRARFSKPVLPGDTVEYTAYTTRATNTYVVGASLARRPVLKSCWLRLVEGT